MKWKFRFNFSSLLMFFALGLLAVSAFAQGDPSQPLFGWQAAAAGALLGFASPYITALFTRLHWKKWQKLAVLYVVSLVLTAVGGYFVQAFTVEGIKEGRLVDLITALFTTGKVTYDWLNASVKLTAAATEPKKS